MFILIFLSEALGLHCVWAASSLQTHSPSFCLPWSLRISVSLEGQFLHYIQRHQFLDSPEWESLRPNEEGKFQVL